MDQGNRGLHSLKDIAADVTEGFCELMDKTRSQMGELDPLEAHVNQREIFKKNLQGLKERGSCSEDSDSGFGVSSSSSGIDVYIIYYSSLFDKQRKAETKHNHGIKNC